MEAEETTQSKVIELLNSATFQLSEKDRIETLSKVQELIVHFDTKLLDVFFEQIVAFQSDKNCAVRKFVVGFIEEACKKDNAMLPRLVPNMELLLTDDATQVVKRVIQAASTLYRLTLVWLSTARITTPEMEQTWTIISRLKLNIVALFDHDNDGVRTQAIKFVELTILTQTYTEADSILRDGEFNLDKIPLTVRVLRPRKLEEEARSILGKLIRFLGSLHISSVNLMTCMSSLSIIARSRPQFMGTVIEALEILHANLPPTLTTSQVNSVRKHLKFQFLNLIKHAGAFEYQDNILNILNDLGVTQNELNKSLPNKDDAKKRNKRTKELEDEMVTTPSKKVCTDRSNSSEDRKLRFQKGLEMLPDSSNRKDSQPDDPPFVLPEIEPVSQKTKTAVDITQRWLSDLLNIESVTDLVMVSMLSLPDKQPSLFSASYTPVSNSGSDAQKNHLARLLASQLTNAGLGPGVLEQEKKELELEKERAAARKAEEIEEEKEIQAVEPSTPALPVGALPVPNTGNSLGLVKTDIEKSQPKKKTESTTVLLPAAVMMPRPMFQKAKFVKLNEVTKPLSWASNQKLQVMLLKRVLNCDKLRLYGGSRKIRMRIVSRFATIANAQEMSELEEFIFSDFSSNSDILLSWLYANHAASQDFLDMGKMFQRANNKVSKQDISYENLLSHIIKRILMIPSNKERNDFLGNLLLECPAIHASALNELLVCTKQGDDAICSMATILKDIIIYRPAAPTDCLVILSELLANSVDSLPETIESVGNTIKDLVLQSTEGSNAAVVSICNICTHNRHLVRKIIHPLLIQLYSNEAYKPTVVDIAKRHLGYLKESAPPVMLMKDSLARDPDNQIWDDDSIKACLYLTLVIIPEHHDFINELSEVYVKTFNDAKRAILRLLETPISNMGKDSPTLMNLVQLCPKGSETLITRIIHILTEKAPPSSELVCHVRDLYNKRVSDVRFLIPVLTGLEKKEVIAVLPKLIQLNPHVVKEVFNRLWGVTLDKGTSPLSPVDLMVALHKIPSDKCDVKTVIKATAMCFVERSIYTPEVLAVVLQQLIEEPALPTLFMRTAIQSLAHHPKLLSFIINILQRLVVKEIWTEKKAWEGFIKCCQRALPQSFTVLLQLPPLQLAQLLNQYADIHKEMTEHVATLTKEQLEHIPANLRDIINDPSTLGIKTEKGFQYAVDTI